MNIYKLRMILTLGMANFETILFSFTNNRSFENLTNLLNLSLHYSDNKIYDLYLRYYKKYDVTNC